jgi:hypothetical protein
MGITSKSLSTDAETLLLHFKAMIAKMKIPGKCFLNWYTTLRKQGQALNPIQEMPEW